MKLMRLVGKGQPSLSCLSPEWKLPPEKSELDMGYITWLFPTLKWAFSPLCDRYVFVFIIFIIPFLLLWTQLVEHIRGGGGSDPVRFACYHIWSSYNPPKGLLLSSHLIDEADEAQRKEVMCLQCLWLVHVRVVWSRTWVLPLNNPPPLFILVFMF